MKLRWFRRAEQGNTINCAIHRTENKSNGKGSAIKGLSRMSRQSVNTMSTNTNTNMYTHTLHSLRSLTLLNAFNVFTFPFRFLSLVFSVSPIYRSTRPSIFACTASRPKSHTGAATSVDVMKTEETESFAMHMIAGYDMKAGKPIGRRYFRADGSFVTEAEVVQEEKYEWMKQDGGLDKDGLRKGTLGGEMF
jgi:hypothetical protein